MMPKVPKWEPAPRVKQTPRAEKIIRAGSGALAFLISGAVVGVGALLFAGVIVLLVKLL